MILVSHWMLIIEPEDWDMKDDNLTKIDYSKIT